MTQRLVLDNGIRVVAERMTGVKSISIGLWVAIGSRDETPDEQGISHFLEHMFFKGTERRSAQEIARKIDTIGGEINAFTSRETTTFYARVLDDHLHHAVDILSDNFHHSLFDSREIAKEKEVVTEEIKMAEDDPEDLVHELHLMEVWKGHPLSRPILGTRETVSSMTRKGIVHFLARTYDPKRIVISVAGHFEMASLLKLIAKSFENYVCPQIHWVPRKPPLMRPSVQAVARNLEQTHLCWSLQGLPDTHPDRYALHVLNAIVGGSVSSRLFQEIRERRGFVYSIYSSIIAYQDGGLMTFYAATRPQNMLKVSDLVVKEIKGLKKKGIDAIELEEAKNHIKGSMMLGMESTQSRMSKLAQNELRFGRDYSLNEVLREVSRVSKRQVHRVVEQLMEDGCLAMTVLGNLGQNKFPEKISLA